MEAMTAFAHTPGLLVLLAWSAPFVMGFFCAYWAQQTGRNAFLWFVFGALLPPFAGIVLLLLNGDRHRKLDGTPGHAIAPVIRKDVI